LYEAKPRGDRNPEGMPFRVRKSSKEGNVVVELRDLPEISNFDQLVNGADTVRVMLESLGGFQRVEADDNPDDIDLQLHIIWKKMVDQGRSQLKQVDITDFDSPYTSEDDYKKRVGVIWNRTTI